MLPSTAIHTATSAITAYFPETAVNNCFCASSVIHAQVYLCFKHLDLNGCICFNCLYRITNRIMLLEYFSKVFQHGPSLKKLFHQCILAGFVVDAYFIWWVAHNTYRVCMVMKNLKKLWNLKMACRSFGQINEYWIFWKSPGNLLYKYLYNRVYVVQLRSTEKNLYCLGRSVTSSFYGCSTAILRFCEHRWIENVSVSEHRDGRARWTTKSKSEVIWGGEDPLCWSSFYIESGDN